jgi:hypothetical protein
MHPLQHLVNELTVQRNQLADSVAVARAELSLARLRVQELEKRVGELTTPSDLPSNPYENGEAVTRQ